MQGIQSAFQFLRQELGTRHSRVAVQSAGRCMFMASVFFLSQKTCFFMGECFDSEWSRVRIHSYLTTRVVDEQCVISSASSKG